MSLENVQAGDVLIRCYNCHTTDIVTVTRVTRTQIVIDDYKYRKSDGRRVGNRDPWGRITVRLPRDGEIEAIKNRHRSRRLVSRINTACERNMLNELPLESLERIWAAVQKEMNDE